MSTTACTVPLTLSVELTDPSILEDLKRTLGSIKGIGRLSVRRRHAMRPLPREEAEKKMRDTLLPALREAYLAKKNGVKYPDIDGIFDLLD